MDKALIPWAYIFFMEVWHYLERRRLVDRLMAKDYNEFKSWDRTKKPEVSQKKLERMNKIYL